MPESAVKHKDKK